MPTTAITPGTSADGNTGSGGASWVDADNINNSTPGTEATITIPPGDQSRLLRMLSPDLSAIPDTATIGGIEVIVSAGLNSGLDRLYLQKSGTNVGSNKAGEFAPSIGSTIKGIAAYAYGGASELWGTTWTPAQLKSGFSVAIGIPNLNPKFGASRSAAFVRVRVNYTEAPASSGNPNTVGNTRRRR